MTKDEFIFYVKGVLDSERPNAVDDSVLNGSSFEFIGPLGLIDKALKQVEE
jgi:hypothetical protein